MRAGAPRPSTDGGGAGRSRSAADVSPAFDGRARAAAARRLSRHRGDLPRRRLHRLVRDDRDRRLELHGRARRCGGSRHRRMPCRCEAGRLDPPAGPRSPGRRRLSHRRSLGFCQRRESRPVAHGSLRPMGRRETHARPGGCTDGPDILGAGGERHDPGYMARARLCVAREVTISPSPTFSSRKAIPLRWARCRSRRDPLSIRAST